MPEIVIVMGYPAAGKTTVVEQYQKTHIRLNRDELGGASTKLNQILADRIESGESFVLDNTYPTIKSRAAVLKIGKEANIPVKCVWLKTSIEDAQFNACQRMIRKYGKLLSADEIRSKEDPNCFPIAALFSYRKKFEKPTLAEGFVSIDEIKFVRQESEYTNKAIILDYDGTLRDTVSGEKWPISKDDVLVLPNTKKVLEKYRASGYQLLGVSNQSWIGKGVLTRKQVDERLQHTNHLLGLEIDYRFCPHKVPPISCYCRKPAPGYGVELIEKYKLNRSECIFVGDQTTDKTFAKRCGFQFKYANDFFNRT